MKEEKMTQELKIIKTEDEELSSLEELKIKIEKIESRLKKGPTEDELEKIAHKLISEGGEATSALEPRDILEHEIARESLAIQWEQDLQKKLKKNKKEFDRLIGLRNNLKAIQINELLKKLPSPRVRGTNLEKGIEDLRSKFSSGQNFGSATDYLTETAPMDEREEEFRKRYSFLPDIVWEAVEYASGFRGLMCGYIKPLQAEHKRIKAEEDSPQKSGYMKILWQRMREIQACIDSINAVIEDFYGFKLGKVYAPGAVYSEVVSVVALDKRFDGWDKLPERPRDLMSAEDMRRQKQMQAEQRRQQAELATRTDEVYSRLVKKDGGGLFNERELARELARRTAELMVGKEAKKLKQASLRTAIRLQRESDNPDADLCRDAEALCLAAEISEEDFLEEFLKE
ncbi:MAG: hypothetical protein GF349_00730 [Candidatus Magasanikbacteria bacterium]|nr:hypothetical protein [Candidatus Magasanikbacteria bacterium]